MVVSSAWPRRHLTGEGAPLAMMARMADELAGFVAGYARRVAPAGLEQHPDASVSSALGVWLLLACCVSVAEGTDRAELEAALGCPAQTASRLLTAFVAAPPAALRSAVAVWVRDADMTAAVSAWIAGLPDRVEAGSMPSQA